MKRIIRILVLATMLSIMFVYYTFANTINIPADYSTIQAGIDAATNGDTVLVQPETYYENINFNGKNITVGSLFLTTQDTSYISQTIIDGNQDGSVVMFENGEDTLAVLCGFVIRNGSDVFGGGLYCNSSLPYLQNLIIKDNCANYGGGIYCKYSAPYLENITIHNNNSYVDGGGIYCDNSSPGLNNVTTTNNIAAVRGGGICCYYYSSPCLQNLIIKDNCANYGGGIYCYYSSLYLEVVTISNNSADAAGGGIYCKNNSSLIFNATNRCNIYSNNTVGSRGFGADFFTIQCDLIDVILDTFTVLPPTDYYASPIDNFTFDILNSIQGNLLNSDVYVYVDGDNTNSGTSPDEPFKTIKYALSRIYSDSMNVNTIHLGEGIFSNSTNGETFPIHWSNYVNLSGSGEDETVLDALHTSGVLKFYYVSVALMKEITIKNGNSADDGGGIYCDYSSPVLENVTITGNSADGGGGIYCNHSSPSLENVTIINNCVSCDGGGIFCKNNSSPSLINAIITGNSASSDGGGICCIFNSSPNLMNTTIAGNSASFDGGGINCEFESSPSLNNITITGNSANRFGGGIYCWESSPILKNVTITGNSAEYYGGGIFCDQSSPRLENITITENSASYGSGIYCYIYSSPILANSIVSDNTGNYGIYIYPCYPGNPKITYSDLYNNEGGNLYGVNDSIGVNVTTNANGDSCDVFFNIQLDPLFVDPSNGDYHLSWTNFPIQDSTMSPCIDAGDPNSPLDPDGTIADMGAYYFNQNVSVDDPQEISNYMLTNYPNPISSNINNLTVSFSIHKPGKVKIQLFNIKGQLVSTLINEDKNIGEYTISHSVNELSSGIYFTRMSVNGVGREIKKVVLLR